MRPATLALALACALPGVPAAAQDDLVPAAIEAQLALAPDPFPGGGPQVPDSLVLAALQPGGTVRAAADLGDASGDGAADLVFGLGPGATRAVVAVDGRDGAPLWSTPAGGRSVRGRRALSARDGRLALGLCGPGGRVELRDAATGALLWARDLAPGAPVANVLAVEQLDDRDGDGLAEVLCTGGAGLASLALLSGADGATLWALATPGPCADARVGPDLSGDGTPDVLAVGGQATPFALALSGADGAPLWSAALPAPGSVALPHVDVDGDGTPDLLAGLFGAPGPCLLALSGADGALLWAAPDIDQGVTGLVAVSDVDGDGLADACVASLENAMNCIGAAQGALLWRSETPITNGGSLLDLAAIGDGDGNGYVDVLASSLDRRAYVFDGRIGVYLLAHELRARAVVAATLADGNGDGRPELVAGGEDALDACDGAGGILAGPVTRVFPAPGLAYETLLKVYAYPTSNAWLLASVGPPGALQLPGFAGTLSINLAQFAVLFTSKVPGAGVLGTLLPPQPREVEGLAVQLQAVTTWTPGHGQVGPAVTWVIGG